MKNQKIEFPANGRCSCGGAQYHLLIPPMFVHCCHCSWCQRETGSAFVINGLIETVNVELVSGEIETIDTPTNSGKGQKIIRCKNCKTALWSHYSGAGDRLAFVRIGTLENPDLCPPDIHIFTSTKQTWLQLGDEVPVVDEYYRRSEYWPQSAMERIKHLTGG